MAIAIATMVVPVAVARLSLIANSVSAESNAEPIVLQSVYERRETMITTKNKVKRTKALTVAALNALSPPAPLKVLYIS